MPPLIITKVKLDLPPNTIRVNAFINQNKLIEISNFYFNIHGYDDYRSHIQFPTVRYKEILYKKIITRIKAGRDRSDLSTNSTKYA